MFSRAGLFGGFTERTPYWTWHRTVNPAFFGASGFDSHPLHSIKPRTVSPPSCGGTSTKRYGVCVLRRIRLGNFLVPQGRGLPPRVGCGFFLFVGMTFTPRRVPHESESRMSRRPETDVALEEHDPATVAELDREIEAEDAFEFRGLDLWDADTSDIRSMIDGETDPEVLGLLWELYEAKAEGDELTEFETIGALSDLLVLNRGGTY